MFTISPSRSPFFPPKIEMLFLSSYSGVKVVAARAVYFSSIVL